MQKKLEWTCLLAFVCCCALWQAAGEQNGGQRYSHVYRKHLQQMARIIDEKVEPCEDYFQHACGQFAAATAGTWDDDDEEESAEKESHVPPFLYNHEDRMHFFEETRAHFGTQVGYILNDLYEDCKQRSRHDVLRGVPTSQWRRMLLEVDFLRANARAYRKWPILRYQWHKLRQRGVHMDWVRLAAAFAAHGVRIFIDIFFAQGTIYIAPVEERCPTVQELSESLQPLLQQRHPQITQIITNELWFFCRELVEAASAADAANMADEVQLENSTLALLDDYFEHYFAILNLTAVEVEAARKIPIKMARLAKLLNVLQQTEPVVVFNYVMWQAYKQLRYEDCYLLTEEFEQLLYAEYWQWYAFEAQLSREVAMATYIYYTTRFQRQRKRTLLSQDWDKFLAVRPKRKDLNVEQLIRQHAQTHLNEQQLASIYAIGVPLQVGAFYANLLLLRRLKLRNSFYEPASDADDHNSAAYFLQQFLHFCILLLKQPLLHYFATQDYELWHASDMLYTADGYYTALDCLQRQLHVHFNDTAETSVFVPPLNALHVEQIYRFHGAFLEAYRDYQFWLEGESFAFAEDFILEYFELNSQRVLFYAVAQLYCGRNDQLYRRQINRSFMNMLEFQAAFNCSVEAPLNPPTKCMLRD